MRAQLKDNNNKLMFTAKTDSAQYFRLGVLNKFDGDTWYYEAPKKNYKEPVLKGCLLYTSDAADERSSVDLGGRRIIKKK